ncbi:phenylacetic acid degradation protein [Klebsiella pneumoniae]|nr:phenylacetic acid degradation protein [Klebsiella pneumoniae]
MLADVKKQLLWQGFGALAPSLLASPSQKLADVQSLLHEAGVAENVICFEAHSPLALSRAALRSRVEECWHLTEQNEMYEAFIALFRPLLPLLRDCDPSELTPDRCFQIQLLLIHFYRRVVLKDPLLPEELLPAHWAGQTARQLCINIYQRVSPARWRLSARKVRARWASSRRRVRSIISALAVCRAHKEVACRYIRLMD